MGFKVSSHSKRLRKINISITSSSTGNSNNTGKKLVDSHCLQNLKTLSLKCSAIKEIRDQLLLSLKLTHGCRSHTQSKWQDNQFLTKSVRRELKKLLLTLMPPSQEAEVTS